MVPILDFCCFLGLALVLPQVSAVNTTCPDPWMFIDVHYRYEEYASVPLLPLLTPNVVPSMLVLTPSPTDCSLELGRVHRTNPSGLRHHTMKPG